MNRAILCAAFLLISAHSAAEAADIEIRHGGVIRRAEVILPKTPPVGPGPAILVLHGGGGSPRRAKRYTEFTLVRRGWVEEIYPAAINRNWNDGRAGADGVPLRTTDDVGFLRALIVRLASDGLIDPARVYVSGASNGGMMTMRLTCDAPELVAGAAILIASWPVGLDCASDKPLPALFLHGTADELIPFVGGRVVARRSKDRGAVLSGSETLKIWANRNRCGGFGETVLPDVDGKDGTRIHRRVYSECAAPLTHFIIDGGGHAWPGCQD